jgi:integrase
MALTDAKVRAAKPLDKSYKLTDGDGMHLMVHTNGSKIRIPHLVPLSRQSIEILKQIYQFSGNHELIFIGDHNFRKLKNESMVNNALHVMGYSTKTEVCGHGFRTMACSSLIESGLWSKDAVER